MEKNDRKNPKLTKLRNIRESRGWTIKDVSQKLGISRSMYGYIENGEKRLTYDNAIKISEIFSLTPDLLFYEDFEEYFKDEIIQFTGDIVNEEILNKVEKKTNVKKDTIIELARKLSNGNMKDEKTIREVIDSLSKATGKKVSTETADKIVKTIQEDKVPNNVEKMFQINLKMFQINLKTLTFRNITYIMLSGINH